MNATEISRTRLQPTSSEEIRLVREELKSVLTNPHFANSKRYPAFLSYVVEKTLEGDATHLKERTLGVELFHRRPDYDTSSDTIVRFAASEVRKRLALIYQESPASHPVQIVLAVGSYTPEFFLINPEEAHPDPAQNALEPSPDSIHGPPAAPIPAHAWRWRWWYALAGLACVLALGWAVRGSLRPAALDRFWAPMLSSQAPILISPGAMVFSPTLTITRADKTVEYPYLSFATANSLAEIVAMLTRDKGRYLVEPSSSLTLTEMRERPVVLLGAYNNDWTDRATGELRYRFAPQAQLKIYDSTNPAVSWSRPASLPYSEADDFAIIARFHARLTQSPMMVLAGIGKNGTEAATQFVTDPRYLNSLESSLPVDWANKNIEFVIKTKVIDGKTGEPTLEAVYVW